ncbi:MAG TPA: alpha/beta fold hydrolase [Candidatus Paceibacterota bacterium]|nr:alpha/beta fold hydrolase [Candidatus Paceibacterota bacterium]
MKDIESHVSGAFIRHFKQHRFAKLLGAVARNHHYLPSRPARANVIVVHGYRAHSRTQYFRAFIDRIRDASWYNVFTVDLPGHGRSVAPEREKERGQIRTFVRIIRTVYAMTYKVLSLRPYDQLPTILVGYSLGALAIVRFLEEYPSAQKHIAGVILIAPPFEVDQNASETVLKYRRVLSPTFDLLSRIFPNWNISDPDHTYDDPLHYNGPLRMRTAASIRSAVSDANAKLGVIRCSVLFIQGEDDLVAPLGATERAFSAIATPPACKAIHIYPGVDHDIFEHRDTQKIVGEILRWIDQHAERAEFERVDFSGLFDDVVEISSIWWFALVNTLTVFQKMLVRYLERGRRILRFFRIIR